MKNDPYSCEHTIYAIMHKEAEKNSGHQRGLNLAILVRCSNQLRAMKPLILEAGQLFVFICSRERDECDRCMWK